MSIFGGTPAPTYVKTTSDQPKWLQDAIYNQINSATTIANTPYQVYGDQRIADPTKATYDAQNLVQDNTGAWIPGMNKAMTGTEALTGQNAGVGTGLNYMQQAAGLNGVTAADPYLQQSSRLVTDAAGQKMLPGVTNYLNQATAMSGLNTAQPYLNQAANTTAQSLSERAMQYADPYMRAAGQSSASYIPEYMNPYNQAVTGQIATLGARNLQENLLPAVSDQFIRAGQFGSKGMGVFGERALRDTQEAVLGQQAQALQSGYGQAVSAAQAESAKQAGLAGTAGQIAGADLSRILSGAGQYGQLGQTAGTLTNAQQQAILQAGQQYGAVGAQDIASQLQAAQQQQNIGQSYGTLTGQQQQNLASIGNQYAATSGTEAQRQQSALQQLASQAQQQQGLMAADAAGLQAVGEQQRLQGYIDPVTGQMVQGQAQLDQAYSTWKEAQDYPKTQADWLNTQIRGMAPNVATSQTQTGTGYGPSVATQIAGGLAGVAGLYKMANPV